ncbi:MAG: precorrin-4 C(11)-methyltransferase [Paramuribaculum sp.]|nr:precorrin-4 C(11)-methyltransferase [Paramuribaculum sp.]
MGVLIIHTNDRSGKVSDKILKGEKSVERISIKNLSEEILSNYEKIIFIGAMGICVRKILPLINNKYVDPAVVCIDSMGKFVIPVLSGHIGGANELSRSLARELGATAVITTQSDNSGLWALDLIGKRYGWRQEITGRNYNEAISRFVNGEKTALCIESNCESCDELISSKPKHVDIYYDFEDISLSDYRLIIVISPKVHNPGDNLVLWFRPKVLSLGVGCRKNCNPEGIKEFICEDMISKGYSPLSIKEVSTISLKKDEFLIVQLAKEIADNRVDIYDTKDLEYVNVPHPSAKVKEVTGTDSVAEACAMKSSDNGVLVIEKQKGRLLPGADFTYAVAINSSEVKRGHIEIVGAGPGDPDLISVRGRKFLEKADLILYAGSLVPIDLTFCAKNGCLVKSSADMDLESQFLLMKDFYDRGKLVVRLHTGDPCIYGAIQEQMAFFDHYGMSYHITPGISSFLAAAAELKSQFTIPEKTQTIILTRDQGRTPMPEKEELHKLAQSQSTMCIFLSASLVDHVQEELMKVYPPTTPVAACYKLTWKDQRIYRGELKDLASIVKDNGLKLTTLIIVGDAIDNRDGYSKLYDREFSHLFRSAKPRT